MEGKRTRLARGDSGDLLFLQYKIKQVAHSAPRMLINSHGCLGFHSLCSFWLSPQPSPCARVSTPCLSVFFSFSGGFYLVSPFQLLQSNTGFPHFALDPLTHRFLLSLSQAQQTSLNFAEPRPPNTPFQWCCTSSLS